VWNFLEKLGRIDTWRALASVAADGVDALLAAVADEVAGAAFVDVLATVRVRVDLKTGLSSKVGLLCNIMTGS
jgi:hypothetical protein